MREGEEVEWERELIINSFIPRYIVLAKDFEKGYKNNIKKDEQEHEFYK